jgi:DNA-binding CsgD family transcriptional regulator/tetratricopeptide (TPR) repeat protein
VDRVGTLLSPVLFGRDDLLELAERRLRQVPSSGGHLLLLAGEAGIGKTRLLGAIERRASATGFRVLRGAAFPNDVEVAAAPFLDMAHGLRRDPVAAESGARLLERLADHDPRGGDTHRRRRLLVLDVVELIASIVDGPTLLALEDLHWADDLTFEILTGLARRMSEVPLVIVATYRSDELFPRVPMREWRARLVTGRMAEEARLGRLTVDETAAMTRLLLSLDGPAAGEIVAAVHARSDGIPLHIEELIGVLDAGRERGEVGRAADVPDTLEAAILERVARLSRRARAAARAGAVIGRTFDPDLLAVLLGQPVVRLGPPLDELMSHFILAPADGAARYDFRHALIRDAIYGRIPEPSRRELHARVAELAATASGVSEAFLSVHFERAGNVTEAFRTALIAGRKARDLNAQREASELYRRALRNVPDGTPAIDHGAILAEWGAVAAATDDNAAAAASFEAARERYLAAGRPVDAAAVVGPLVAVRHLLGDGLAERVGRLEVGLAELDAAADDADTDGRQSADRTRAGLLAGLSAAYMLDRRLDESIHHGEAARELAADVGDETVELDVMATLGSDLVFAGRMDEGWAMLETALGRARDAHREAAAGRAYRMIGSSASVLVEYRRGESWLREGIAYTERVESWNHRHYMAAHLAHILWATGRWDEAVSVAEHALADGRGGITTRITALLVIGYVAFGRGDGERARVALDEARQLAEPMGELQRLSPALWGIAELDVSSGDLDMAIAGCERGRAASAAVDDAAYLFPFLVTGTRAHLRRGDPGGAERWVADLTAAIRTRSIPGTLPAIDHATGLILMARGATGRARTALGNASSAWTALGRVWEGTAALLDLAECQLRSNQAAGALRSADQARLVAGQLGSPMLLDRADQILRAGRARHPTDEPWAPLSSREFEVARFIAAGLTNAQIGAELTVASRTVGAHVEHILGKLGMSRRAEIAAWAIGIRDRAARSDASSDR